MRRKYVSPECIVVSCEMSTFIAASTTQTRISTARENNEDPTKGNSWGNIWNN